MLVTENKLKFEPVNNLNPVYKPNISFSAMSQNDSISIVKIPPIQVRQRGKVTQFVSFSGLNTNPEEKISSQAPIGIQMRVRNVKNHQFSEIEQTKAKDNNVGNLAKSDWKDGQPLNHSIRVDEINGICLALSVPEIGEVGIVPQEILYPTKDLNKRIKDLLKKADCEDVREKLQDASDKMEMNNVQELANTRESGRFMNEIKEIIEEASDFSSSNELKTDISKLIRCMEAPPILDLIKANPKDFKFELSNVIAGTTKGASTIGLRVNLLYTGTDENTRKKAADCFNTILNEPSCAKSAMLYQPPTSPEEVFKSIIKYEEDKGDEENAKKIRIAMKNIVKEIKDPENKNILLVGHCKPDGDTLGCILAMKNAIELADREKIRELLHSSIKLTDSQPLIQILNRSIELTKSDGITDISKKLLMESIGAGIGSTDSQDIKNNLNEALLLSKRKIDCSVDDKVPGLFRHNLPGIDGEVLQPYKENRIQELKNSIAIFKKDLKNDGDNKAQIQGQIKILEDEIKDYDPRTKKFLNPKSKYDVVMMMDVPTPERFTDAYKDYIKEAKKVIYIDHHPHREQEWKDKADWTGINMNKIHNSGLALIADTVPAATQLVTIIASKLGIKAFQDKDYDITKAPKKDQENLKALAAAAVVGMATDTGAFTRTANLLPEHMEMAVQNRPNFMPEGLAKWLMEKIPSISKKFLREEISYDITEEKGKNLPKSARDIMIEKAIAGKVTKIATRNGEKQNINEDLSLGIIQVNYDDMDKVWRTARTAESKKPETTLLDVQNGYKYCEAMGTLRSNPYDHAPIEFKKTNDPSILLSQKAMEDYEGNYDNDRNAILICQDKKAGKLDEKLNIAKQNGLRLSMRSQDGTIWAELLANLFHGGGHGGASGGRVDLPGVELHTKLAVKVTEKIDANSPILVNNKEIISKKDRGDKVIVERIERDPKVILQKLLHNYEVMNTKLTNEQKQARIDKLEVVLDEKGRNCSELIADVVTEIRNKQNTEIIEKRKQD